ncbi:hypothetical protein GKR75_08150 [Providencia sp. wls1919]|nr:hypothetical protein [Providencia sp. wls1919]
MIINSNESITVSRSKIHRHYKPKFTGVLPKLVPVRRFAAALKGHDWNRNPHLYKLRAERNQRISIRSEKRETFYALALAMIANADYNPESEYIFEVMCSTEQLADMCSQLHKYESGRISYDPTLHAIHDWEAAGLILVDREQDKETKQNKAQRIWIKPAFFHGLGFSIKELRKIALSFRQWMEKHGLSESYKEKYAKHVMRLARSNVASLDKKTSLQKLLLKIKRLVVGDNEMLRQEKKHLAKAIKYKKELAKSTQEKDSPERLAWKKFEAWKSTQPIAVVMAFESQMKNLYPNAVGHTCYLNYIKHLPD